VRRFERLIADHAARQTSASLQALGAWIVQSATLHAPLSGLPAPGQGLPVICVTTERGPTIPAFSSPERLAAWKPGAQYADIPGRILLDMAQRMPQIAGVYLDMGAASSAWIDRDAFPALLAL
jgi:type III secretion system (T3SS) SseB-like protein